MTEIIKNLKFLIDKYIATIEEDVYMIYPEKSFFTEAIITRILMEAVLANTSELKERLIIDPIIQDQYPSLKEDTLAIYNIFIEAGSILSRSALKVIKKRLKK